MKKTYGDGGSLAFLAAAQIIPMTDLEREVEAEITARKREGEDGGR